VQLGLDYGGRDEITQAVRKIVASGVSPEEVNEELISQNLYTAGIPDPDLIIRTSGEMRTSNFLIWQSAYAEWVSPKPIGRISRRRFFGRCSWNTAGVTAALAG